MTHDEIERAVNAGAREAWALHVANFGPATPYEERLQLREEAARRWDAGKVPQSLVDIWTSDTRLIVEAAIAAL